MTATETRSNTRAPRSGSSPSSFESSARDGVALSLLSSVRIEDFRHLSQVRPQERTAPKRSRLRKDISIVTARLKLLTPEFLFDRRAVRRGSSSSSRTRSDRFPCIQAQEISSIVRHRRSFLDFAVTFGVGAASETLAQRRTSSPGHVCEQAFYVILKPPQGEQKRSVRW